MHEHLCGTDGTKVQAALIPSPLGGWTSGLRFLTSNRAHATSVTSPAIVTVTSEDELGRCLLSVSTLS